VELSNYFVGWVRLSPLFAPAVMLGECGAVGGVRIRKEIDVL
jgi:hypothetical protein